MEATELRELPRLSFPSSVSSCISPYLSLSSLYAILCVYLTFSMQTLLTVHQMATQATQICTKRRILKAQMNAADYVSAVLILPMQPKRTPTNRLTCSRPRAVGTHFEKPRFLGFL